MQPSRSSLPCPGSSSVTFTSSGVPSAPDSCSPISPPPASQCRLRAPRPPRASHLPCTLDSAPRTRLPRRASPPGPGPARTVLPLPSFRLSPSRSASLLLQPWRILLCCGPETFLPASSALGTIVVICDCPLSWGARTPWTGLPRRERRGKGGTGAPGLGSCQGSEPAPRPLDAGRLPASPPLRTRHVRASHGRGPSQTTPRPPPARPQPPHRLDTRGSRVLIG